MTQLLYGHIGSQLFGVGMDSEYAMGREVMDAQVSLLAVVLVAISSCLLQRVYRWWRRQRDSKGFIELPDDGHLQRDQPV